MRLITSLYERSHRDCMQQSLTVRGSHFMLKKSIKCFRLQHPPSSHYLDNYSLTACSHHITGPPLFASRNSSVMSRWMSTPRIWSATWMWKALRCPTYILHHLYLAHILCRSMYKDTCVSTIESYRVHYPTPESHPGPSLVEVRAITIARVDSYDFRRSHGRISLIHTRSRTFGRLVRLVILLM